MNVALRQARKQAKLTQKELAQLLGYKGAQSVSNWENSRIQPPLSVAIQISRVLNAPIEELFFED